MVIIYSPDITPRLQYAVKIIFGEVLGIDFELTSEKTALQKSGNPVIAYSIDSPEGILSIRPSGLLGEKGIQQQEVLPGKWGDLPTLFKNEAVDLPFDLFSAVFYLTSRYEEYLPFEPDEHGRFPAELSISYKEDFLRLPIIDLWSKKLSGLLGIEADCKNIETENYKFQLTVDIDQAWLYKNKGLFYNMLAGLRDILTLNIRQFITRVAVLTHLSPDPGDSFSYLIQIQNQLDQAIKFFALCQGKKEHDKNRALGSKAFDDLLQKLDAEKLIGIHPSYASNEEKGLMEKEVSILKEILGRDISISRQHYLKLRFPTTFQHLISQGIHEDYSLGYGSQTGFRSGIARSYNFYDLSLEKETNLRLTPLIIMDRTLKDSLQYDAFQAKEEYSYYIRQIRNIGGEFVCLWHNDSLSDRGEWKNWKQVFEYLIEKHKAS